MSEDNEAERLNFLSNRVIGAALRVHNSAQVRSHLRFSSLKLQLLINFTVASVRDGIKRIGNGFPERVEWSLLCPGGLLNPPLVPFYCELTALFRRLWW